MSAVPGYNSKILVGELSSGKYYKEFYNDSSGDYKRLSITDVNQDSTREALDGTNFDTDEGYKDWVAGMVDWKISGTAHYTGSNSDGFSIVTNAYNANKEIAILFFPKLTIDQVNATPVAGTLGLGIITAYNRTSSVGSLITVSLDILGKGKLHNITVTSSKESSGIKYKYTIKEHEDSTSTIPFYTAPI